MKLAAFSELTRDYYPQIDYYSADGNVLNFAVQFKKYTDEPVAVVGAIGNDLAGKIILDKVKGNKLDDRCIHRIDGITAQNHLRVDKDGERYGIEGTSIGGVFETYHFNEDDLSFINQFDCAATTAYDPNFESVIKHLNPNIKFSVDFFHLGDFDLLEKYIDRVSVAFFEGKEELFEKAKRIAHKNTTTPIVIILGAGGSKAFLGNKEYFLPAPKVEKVIDTTGCGDSYQAAFAYIWFSKNNIEAAMEQGTIAAGKTLSHFGGIE